jgi:hypothetical protein
MQGPFMQKPVVKPGDYIDPGSWHCNFVPQAQTKLDVL